jgi:hypothetical protein
MQKKYQSTLSYSLLIYMSIMVVIMSLIPFEFRTPDEFRIFLIPDLTDFSINIILFIPVGFLFGLSRGKNPGWVSFRVKPREKQRSFLPDGSGIWRVFKPGN